MTRRSWLTLAVAATAALVLAQAASGGATGTLKLSAALRMSGTPGSCPPGTNDAYLCSPHTGDGTVPGLGSVSESYNYIVLQQNDCSGFHLGATPASLSVAGKGTIELRFEASADCFPSALRAKQGYTVTGGTGIYRNASGSGMVVHDAAYTTTGSAGTDTFTGTLLVPGLTFDLTPPTISGAVDRKLRVHGKRKRARVKYKVSAVDEADGPVAVACTPKSGSRFRVGRRTVVRCSATDSSANSATALFTVTVRR